MSMKKKKKLVIMMGVALALVLGLSHPTLAVAQEASEPAEPGSGLQTGIKVHGHWTIEVRNPDGTLVTRREFENALRAQGSLTLARILGVKDSVGLWRVLMGSPPGPQACDPSNQKRCQITESRDPASEVSTFKTLTLDVPPAGSPNAGKFVLSGTATAAQNSEISEVDTVLTVCTPNVAPLSCTSLSGNIVTGTLLSPFVQVFAGQIIQVTVVISFS